MRCQQYQPLIADKCPCEAVCRECDRCEAHCFCGDMETAIREMHQNLVSKQYIAPEVIAKIAAEAAATYDALRPALLEEIRIADIATLWDAGVRVADDEFDGNKFKV
jgi:hypothetical protein